MQADGLQLIPASVKRAAGIQYEIHLDRAGATASELIDVDIKVSIPLIEILSRLYIRDGLVGRALPNPLRPVQLSGFVRAEST